jgi:hypothetical protein
MTAKYGLGEDSVLLHYPFDFILTVPFAALKRRSVYCDSRELNH